MSTIEQSYDHVIVGAGMAAAKALEAIRDTAPGATVAVFGAEQCPPVYRPMLSKDLWLTGKSLADAVLVPEDDPALHLGATVESLDTGAKQVTLADGTVVGYGSLLLATGAEPQEAGLPRGERVVYFRTTADYERLRDLTHEGAQIAVVGGGYIGSEIAAALSQNGVEVTLIVPDDLPLSHMFPPALAHHVTDAFHDHDVRLVSGRLAGGKVSSGRVTLKLADGSTLAADGVVIGVGVTPRTRLAELAGIEVDDGIVVDDHLRTSAPDVYAAGDVASFPDARLGRRRVEHADNAESMGETAGRIMAGEDAAYDHTPYFWSDLYEDGYEAVGEISTEHEAVVDAKDGDFSAAVVYYLDEGRVRGVLLWNTWDSVPAATELIERTATEPVSDPESLKGAIPLG